jgi:hypothetical protein
MDISEYIREPLGAAAFAMLAVVAYIYIKARMNSEPKPQTSQYVKPAFLVGLLVYFIVSNGSAAREKISTEPF